MAGAISVMSSRALRLLALGTVVATGLNLTGCASATRLVANPNQSSTLKAKNLANYKELYLLPPDSDPRNGLPAGQGHRRRARHGLPDWRRGLHPHLRARAW
jgi:hypothetical protein